LFSAQPPGAPLMIAPLLTNLALAYRLSLQICMMAYPYDRGQFATFQRRDRIFENIALSAAEILKEYLAYCMTACIH
jgi:hypothetical protein